MDRKLFRNNEVKQILNLTQREVISWTEKSLIEPVVQAKGAGSKREYSYVNLLELALCKELFDMGLGVYSVKSILLNLREDGDLDLWAQDFNEFFEKVAQTVKEDIQEFREGLKQEKDIRYWHKSKEIKDLYSREKAPTLEEIIAAIRPSEPIGILIYVFQGEEQFLWLSPWDMRKTIDGRLLDDIVKSEKAIIFDLGKIKKKVDKGICEL